MKHLLLLILSLLPMLANADAVEIDGIYYNLIPKGNFAEVVSSPDLYSGAIEIPGSVTYEGVDYSVTSIGDHAFDDCTDLTSVILPEGMTTIGYRSFGNCSYLTSITIPSTLKRIKGFAFERCDSLSMVIVKDIAAWCGIVYDNSIFSGCFPLYYAKHLYSDDGTEITEVVIPEGVTRIEPLAFRDAKFITSVSIPSSVTYIGEEAFRGMHSLTSINLPQGITSITPYMLQDCEALTSVRIPSGVTSIGAHAFRKCYALRSVNIPSGVTSIGESTFSSCTSLTSIRIPDNVTSIGSEAFAYCSGLTSVKIPDNVTYIGNGAFRGCNGLTSIAIGMSVTNIEYGAFASCPKLEDVYCYAMEPVVTSADVFDGSYIEAAILHVPKASLQLYMTTSPWNNFGRIVSTEDGVEPEIRKCATPSISYVNGELVYDSETEGVEFVSEITDTDITTHYSKSIPLTATYHISVYATRTDYENSDTVRATLCWIDAEPRTEGLQEDAVAEVKALPVLIHSQGGIVSIQGAAEGTLIAICGIDGKKEGSAIAIGGGTTINTSLKPGSVAVVKIGEKAVKVVIR